MKRVRVCRRTEKKKIQTRRQSLSHSGDYDAGPVVLLIPLFSSIIFFSVVINTEPRVEIVIVRELIDYINNVRM